MKKTKRLSLALIVFSLFSVSCLVSSVSAQEGPPGGPPGDEDPCMKMPPGEAQDECYINLDEDLGPEDAHCEEMHEGKDIPEPTEADIARYEAEYRANMANGGQGRLNESTYAELQGKGFSRAEIDCHVGEMAEAAMHDAEADEPVPGEGPGMPGGQPGMPGDPCMAVPAGPDRDACHATTPPPGQPGMPGQPPAGGAAHCAQFTGAPRAACEAAAGAAQPPAGGAAHCAQFTGAPRAACEAAAAGQ